MELIAVYVVILAGAFCSCIVLIWTMQFLATLPERQASKNRLKRYLRDSEPLVLPEDEVEVEETTTPKRSRKDLLPLLTKALAGRDFTENMTHELQRARIHIKVSEYLYIWLSLTALALILGMLIFKNVFVALLLGGLAFRMPYSYVKGQQKKWLNRLNDQIGDTLILISNCLKSGYSFLQSLDMVAREALPPMSEECAKMLQEISLGNTVEKAMLSMEERVGSEDMELVITAVLIQREIGGSLAEILENIAETIRERIRIKGEIKTLTAQGRLSGYVVGSLPIALFFIINFMNRSYMITLTTSIVGWIMIAIGIVMQILGFLIIRKIVDIEV